MLRIGDLEGVVGEGLLEELACRDRVGLLI